MLDPAKAFYICATGIIMKDGKMLIAKRSEKEKAFPGKWTVPGGKMEQHDYTSLPKNKAGQWYHAIEATLQREIMEEVALTVTNIQYVCSLAFPRHDGAHCIVISYACDYKSGSVILSEELTEYAWVTLEQAKGYDFIEGIYEELELTEKKIKGKKN